MSQKKINIFWKINQTKWSLIMRIKKRTSMPKSRLMIVLLAICFSVSVYAMSSHPVIRIGNDQIVTELMHETNLHMNYAFDIQYPQIKGKNLNDATREFNAAIKSRVQDNIVALKKLASTPKANQKQLNTLKMDYDIAVIKPRNIPLISVRFTIEEQPADYPHETVYHEMFNYNLKVGLGKDMSIESLFNPNSNYAAVLSHYYGKKLLAIKGVTKKDVEEIATNLPNWNFRPDGLLLTFDDLPVNIKPREVLVPYPVLAKVISIYTPIAICTKKPNACKK